MNGKAAILTVQVDVFDAAVLKVGGSVHVESEAFFFQLPHRSSQVRRAHGNVTVFTQERCFHALEVRTAELGLLAVGAAQD